MLFCMACGADVQRAGEHAERWWLRGFRKGADTARIRTDTTRACGIEIGLDAEDGSRGTCS